MQHRVRECIAQTGPCGQSVAKRRSLAAPRLYVRTEHISSSTYQDSKTAVRLSRVHFKIWVAQGFAPLLRRNPMPPVDATLHPAWTTLATVVSLKEKAMFQGPLVSGCCFVPAPPFLSAFAGGSASQVTHPSLGAGPTNCGPWVPHSPYYPGMYLLWY